MQIKEYTFKAFILASITEGFGYLSNFFIIFILSQIFTPEEFVYYPFSLTFLLFFLLFANFGISKTIIRFISASKEEGQIKIEKVVSEGFKLICVFTIISSLVMFFMADFIEEIYAMKGLGITLKYASLYLIFFNLIEYFESTFLGLWNFKLYSISSISLNFLKLIIVTMNFHYKMQIYMIFLLFSILAAVQLVCIVVLIQIKYQFFKKLIKINQHVSSDILKFSFFVFLPLLFQFLIINFNQFILAYYISPRELAYYLITLKIILFLSMPIFIIYRIIFPYLVNFFKNKEVEKVQLVYNAIFKYGFLIMVPTCVYVFFTADYLIVLIFGPLYSPLSIYLRIYMIYLLLKLIDLTGETFLLASNKPKTVLKLSAITAFFTLILSLLLIPRYEVYGAIISIIGPHSIYILYSNRLVKKQNNLFLNKKILFSMFKYILSSILSLCIIFIFVVPFSINLNNSIFMVTLTALYIFLYFIFILIFKAIRINEVKEIVRIVKTSFIKSVY